MKQGLIIILRSWTNRKVTATLMAIFVVCTFLRFPAPDTMCQIPLLATASLQSSSKTAQEIEYEVKAAFIYNFMKFVEWPENKHNSPEESQDAKHPMVIGILGVNPFDSAFQPILDKDVHGRKIHLIEIQSYQQFYKASQDKENAFAAYQAEYQKTIQSCDVLFICNSESGHVQELLLLTLGNQILTVSDIADFARKEGVIGFVKDNNKIRFEINLDAAQTENIKIRSQLLTLAKKVYESKKKPG